MAFLAYNGKFLTRSSKWIGYSSPTPPTPTLPPSTVRVRFTEGITPTFSRGTAVQVSTSPNIWDLTCEHFEWYYVLANQPDLLEVVEFNTVGITDMSHMLTNSYYLQSVCLFDTSNVTDMGWMFGGCSSLTSIPLLDTSKVTDMSFMFYGCVHLVSVPLFDTSSVTDMESMFSDCYALQSVPLFDTSSVTNMGRMFYNCYNVQSGALALYQQASAQSNPIAHTDTFTNCGCDTMTGAAELAQIPVSWGGTMA